ncbi:MAG TPA: hypothetical protein VMC84_07215 [Methanocella sp.]|uniref:carboxypeptidase-like regulatory domain-containing protein n=1 Tax=Methanocella sp. TaxID=2052833 RepID=UPI002B878634|nr:hypothetical protein [Methanocella sp.]HTY90953.1 hypothetical protein [Methanocella sp.]
MPDKRLVLPLITVLIAALFFISPVLACYYPGPTGSSITVFTHTSDGTPLPGTQLTLYVYNGSKTIATESGSTGHDGKFTFPSDGSDTTGLSYKVHATYYGDTVTVECVEGSPHSADSDIFTLGDGNKPISLTIDGVTVIHSGTGDSPAPTTNPEPTTKPIIPKGDHISYPPMADGDVAGTVSGVVLSADSAQPIKGAYVAIVKADGVRVECTSPNVEYSCAYTDASGFFQFNGVNSTKEAIYKLYVTDGCGNVAYSDPFMVNSSQSVQINVQLARKSCDTPAISPTPTVTVEPIATPTEEATVSPSPSAEALAMHADMAVNSPSIIDQIAGFIGDLISSIIPK